MLLLLLFSHKFQDNHLLDSNYGTHIQQADSNCFLLFYHTKLQQIVELKLCIFVKLTERDCFTELSYCIQLKFLTRSSAKQR